MESGLKQLIEAAKKVADAAANDGGGVDSLPEEDLCIDALNGLKKFPDNYEVVVSTQSKTARHQKGLLNCLVPIEG